MAHRIRVYSAPHVNANGETSTSKKNWFFRDRTRNRTFISQPYGSEKTAREEVEKYRSRLVEQHQISHPHDLRGMKQQNRTGGAK